MIYRFEGHYKVNGRDTLRFVDKEVDTTKTGFGFDTEHDAKNAIAFARFLQRNKIKLD